MEAPIRKIGSCIVLFCFRKVCWKAKKSVTKESIKGSIALEIINSLLVKSIEYIMEVKFKRGIVIPFQESNKGGGFLGVVNMLDMA
jgi:hypothetical protein